MGQKIEVRSDAFEDAGMIPKEYGREGENISPQLSWDTLENVKSWALIADDPDAPNGTFVHWVLFNLPPEKTSLPPGASRTKDKLNGAIEGVNGRGEAGYTGPNPPTGTHRYFFKVFGLDTTLDLGEGATKEQVLEAIAGHKVAEGQLMGRYTKEGSETAKGVAP
jgi:Raf kinase inhibitor-like YbhB/YbcL family protein